MREIFINALRRKRGPLYWVAGKPGRLIRLPTCSEANDVLLRLPPAITAVFRRAKLALTHF